MMAARLITSAAPAPARGFIDSDQRLVGIAALALTCSSASRNHPAGVTSARAATAASQGQRALNCRSPLVRILTNPSFVTVEIILRHRRRRDCG